MKRWISTVITMHCQGNFPHSKGVLKQWEDCVNQIGKGLSWTIYEYVGKSVAHDDRLLVRQRIKLNDF